MTRWWLILALAASCKSREIPYTPPKQDAAAAQAIDASAQIDAAEATTKAGAVKVAVGENFSCAVLSDKTLRCWGRNSEGQLGTGSTTDAPSPGPTTRTTSFRARGTSR